LCVVLVIRHAIWEIIAGRGRPRIGGLHRRVVGVVHIFIYFGVLSKQTKNKRRDRSPLVKSSN